LEWDAVKGARKYWKTFQTLKPRIIERLEQILVGTKVSSRGRKRTTDLGIICDGLWHLSDSGIKMGSLADLLRIPRSTLFYYFNIIRNTNLMADMYKMIISEYYEDHWPEYLITDSFTVKSIDGTEGTGRNPTDRGRRGIKVSLICDENRITTAVHISGANTHDSKLLIPTHKDAFVEFDEIDCLADSAYVGKNYIPKIHDESAMSLISKPKKMSNGKLSHILTADQLDKLSYRNRIELLNGHIRRFRGVTIKYVKSIKSYRVLLFLSLLVITCYQIFVSL